MVKQIGDLCSLEVQTRLHDISCTISSFVPSQTPRSVSTTQNLLYLFSWPKAAFLPSSNVFFNTFFQNMHCQYALAWLKAHRWRWKGSLHLPHKTRGAAEWSFYYDYPVLMIEGSQNRNWNSINRPALFSNTSNLRNHLVRYHQSWQRSSDLLQMPVREWSSRQWHCFNWTLWEQSRYPNLLQVLLHWIQDRIQLWRMWVFERWCSLESQDTKYHLVITSLRALLTF